MSQGLQIAVGSYGLYDANLSTASNNVVLSETIIAFDDLVYYEPGYTTNSPIDIEIPKSDFVKILIRKRVDDEYEEYDNIYPRDFSANVVDGTTQGDLTATFSTTREEEWIDPYVSQMPLVLTILLAPYPYVYRTKVINSYISDVRDSKFVSFRITMYDSSLPFGSLIIDTGELWNRPLYSSYAVASVMNVSDAGSYVLISPSARIAETEQSGSVFSYPSNVIFYRLDCSTNRESYDYSISDASHDVIANNVRVIPVPLYPQAAIVFVDGHLRTDVSSITGRVWFDVEAVGKISGDTNTFRMYIDRSRKIYYL